MDIGSQKILELILGKSVGTITEEDRKFLIARRSYVTDKDFERLGIDIAAEVAAIEKASAPEVAEEKPVAKKPVAKKA